VFQKPQWKLSLRRLLMREITIWNANRIGGLESVPRPKRQRL
jgi:hypothetical protein